MATVGSAIVCDRLRLYGNRSLCDRLRSTIRDRLRSFAIIWKPAFINIVSIIVVIIITIILSVMVSDNAAI